MLHHLGKRLIVSHARGVWCVLVRILVGRVSSYLGGDVVSDALRDPVGVGEQRAELFIADAGCRLAADTMRCTVFAMDVLVGTTFRKYRKGVARFRYQYPSHASSLA